MVAVEKLHCKLISKNSRFKGIPNPGTRDKLTEGIPNPGTRDTVGRGPNSFLDGARAWKAFNSRNEGFRRLRGVC